MAIWRLMIDMGAVDVVQPEVCYLGGIIRTLQVARMAKAADSPCYGLSGSPRSASIDFCRPPGMA